MEIIFIIAILIFLIGIKLVVLLFVLNKEKKYSTSSQDEDILDGKT